MGSDYIALEDCIPRHVYRLRSRNLIVGVFDGDRGFIGIRMKFDAWFLFKEYHADTGSPLGTVYPVEDLGELPPEIGVTERVGFVCDACGARVLLVGDRWQHMWGFLEEPEDLDHDLRPVPLRNGQLFDFLAPLDYWESERWRKEFGL